jgi:hypothetical protein
VGPRLRYAAISVLIATVPIVLVALATRGGEGGRPPEPLAGILIYGAAQWYPWAALAPLIDRRIRRGGRGTSWLRQLSGHAAQFAVFVLLHTVVLQAAAGVVAPDEGRSFARALASGLAPEAILYAAIAGGFAIAESRRRQTEVAERLRTELAEARLDALRQQLNPHFLFNTLNHIAAELRSGDVTPALNMTVALGDLLRDVLRERAQLIPLRDELRMVERYLEIERERFADRLQVRVTFEPRALEALVPSLLLQPLIENAVRHGISAADGRCNVTLDARLDGSRLILEVRDAGPGLAAARDAALGRPGIGLSNTAERLRYLFGPDHRFELRALDEGGVLVRVDLPFRRS